MVGICSWKNEYVNNDILDGIQWSLKLIYIAGQMKEIDGSIAYPDSTLHFIKEGRVFTSFLNTLRKMIGEPHSFTDKCEYKQP